MDGLRGQEFQAGSPAGMIELHRKMVLQLEGPFRVQDPRLLHAAVGIVTEAGELLGQVKKHGYTGAPIDRVNLIEELGDLLWYAVLMFDVLGVSFEEVLRTNYRKLQHRYGHSGRFSAQESLSRNVEAERRVLEGGHEG